MSDDLVRDSLQPMSAQRRHLSILFADLSDSTKIADSMEAELYAELLSEVHRICAAVIPKHGGTIVQIQGDGLLAVFGYPQAGENDGRRATEAALELHKAVKSCRGLRSASGPSQLTLHSGIHSGLVLMQEGDPVVGRFELLGNAVNIASRLCDEAQSDEILVSEETLGPESHFFQTSERRSLSLKGRSTAIAVYRVLAHAAIATRFEARAQRGLVPFIGRGREHVLLEAALKDSTAGRPRFVAIVGPAGMGKTRLAEEFVNRAAAAGCSVHRGYCESYLGAEPLKPFLQILRSLFDLRPGILAAEAAQHIERKLEAVNARLLAHSAELLRSLSLSAEADGGRPKAQQSAEDTIAALRELFDSLAASRPLVLFVDDWQWADDASRQAADAIRSLKGRPVLLLVATREFAAGDVDLADAERLQLTPFTEDEAAETIDRLLPGSDPFVAEEICLYSGGNPLFIEEMCHLARTEGPGARLGRAHGGTAWLETLIESRVSRLPEAQAELLRAAAVIGNVVPSWLLTRVTGHDEGHPLVRGLAAQDFLYPGEGTETLRFKHGITRDAIYKGVGLHQRRAMHRRIAELLRQQAADGAEQEFCEALAYHYAAAGEATQAAHYAELAGDKAMAASALDRAKAQYRAALDALDLLEPAASIYHRWRSIVRRLGLAGVFDPAREEIDVFRRAVDLAHAHDDLAGLAHAQYWLAYINYALGESRAAIHHCELALAAATQLGNDPLKVQIRTIWGQTLAAAGEYDRALALLDEAVAVRRQQRTGDRPAVGFAYSLACKASVLGDRGQFEQAYACFQEALDSVRDGGHEVEGSILSWRSGVCLWQGRWEDARRDALAAQRVAERVRSLYIFAMSRGLGAYAAWKLERSAESLQALIDATSWLEARDKGLFISLNYGWLAESLVASGRIGEARRYAARALKRARKLDRIGEAMACRAIARASAGDSRAAGHYLDQAMRAARARGSAHEVAVNQLCQAEIALAQGHRSAAAAALDQAVPAFEAMRMNWHLDQAARLRRAI